MSSINFSSRSRFTGKECAWQQAARRMALEQQLEHIAKEPAFLLSNPAQKSKIHRHLRNAQRFLSADELGACQFELDCVAQELLHGSKRNEPNGRSSLS